MPPKKKEPSKPAASTPSGGSAEDFEKLGVFYLGRPYDLATKQATGRFQAGTGIETLTYY